MLTSKLRGRYKIIEHLGRGGFGDAYLALDEDLPGTPRCVVKHLKPRDPNPDLLDIARRLFKKEAEVLYRLKHPQIPALLANFEENGEFYLVQDYIDGEDLSRTEITPGKRLSEAIVIKLLQDILEILAFVHQQNVIHRDIKPSNLIRRRQDGKIFLIDFGAVKEIKTLVMTPGGQTSVLAPIGTPGYMPSEQASGHPQLCSDVYAVGMLGIQALTGIVPSQLQKDSTLQVIWRERVQVSPQLTDILDKMVRYDFSQRFHSAVEALQEFQQLTIASASTVVTHSSPTQQSASVTSPPSQPSTSTNESVFSSKLAWVLGLSAVLLAVLVRVVPILWPPTPPPQEIAATYENSTYRIKIKYPQSWGKQENPDIITKKVVEFIAPRTNNSGEFPAKMIIYVEDLSSPLSLEEYTKNLKQQIIQPDASTKIISEGESTLAGKSAYQIVRTGMQGKFKLKTLEVWTLKNYKAYSIVYIASADKYDDFLKAAETTIKSLQVENVAQR